MLVQMFARSSGKNRKPRGAENTEKITDNTAAINRNKLRPEAQDHASS